MIINKIKRFKLNSDYKGVFSKMYAKDRTFASFDSCKQASDSSGESSIINDNLYWMSENISNSYITLIFNKNTFVLSNISLCSCLFHSCVYNIDLFGSNIGEKWEKICQIRKEKNYFYKNKNYAECQSNFAYKMIKLVNSGLNFNDNNKFSIRHLDLYGDLYREKPNNISPNRCKKQSFLFYCISLMTIL